MPGLGWPEHRELVMVPVFLDDWLLLGLRQLFRVNHSTKKTLPGKVAPAVPNAFIGLMVRSEAMVRGIAQR